MGTDGKAPDKLAEGTSGRLPSLLFFGHAAECQRTVILGPAVKVRSLARGLRLKAFLCNGPAAPFDS
jgi:hypothetical protein